MLGGVKVRKPLYFSHCCLARFVLVTFCDAGTLSGLERTLHHWMSHFCFRCLVPVNGIYTRVAITCVITRAYLIGAWLRVEDRQPCNLKI